MLKIKKLKRAVIKEELVALTGDFINAVVLNQLIYWSERVSDFDEFIEQEKERFAKFGDRESMEIQIEPTHGWIYKTAEDLSAETMLNLSRKSMRAHLKELIDAGYIQERSNPHYAWDKTKQYLVNIAKIQHDLKEIGYCLDGYSLESPKGNIEREKSYIRCYENDRGIGRNETAIPEITTETTFLSKKERKEHETKKQSEKESFDELIDSYTQNEELRSELKEHLKTRKMKKAALTNRAVKLSLQTLDKLSKNDDEKIKIVQNAIINGWTAFYPLREPLSNNEKNSYDISQYEALMDSFA